ncbi:hypothetical protein MKX03_036089 [Papaver bracteatum]|nr:hypothetical protein MKX03_036089 [Papaver bracteatum]
MAQIPNLDNAPLNLTSLREESQKDLLTILKNIGGNKCLILDQQLSGSLSLIIETSILKEHVQTGCTKVVYLIRSQMNLVKLISAHIRNDISKGTTQREYYVYFVPRRTVACEKIFDEEKVHHLLTIGEYPLYMIPLDEDVLSFELDRLAYRDYLVDGDTSALWHIAKSIRKLEYSFGVIPNVMAKGKASARIAEILTRMQVEEEPSDVGIPEINTLILLDREVDMVTPMCFQLTYEGVMDEILHVDNGCVELDASIIMDNQQQQGKQTKVPLNSSDKIFKETRDLNFGVIVQFLNQKATDMRQDYKEFHTANQSFTEVKDFHVNLAQHLTTFTSKPSFSRKLDMELTVVVQDSSYKVVDGKRSLVLVVFVGGVTFAEISALRFLSAQEGMAYDLIVGTTIKVNGHTIIETFLETIG